MWTPENDTSNFTDTDPAFPMPPMREQARKCACQWAKPEERKAKLMQQGRRIILLSNLTNLSLWVACGCIIAALMVCRNDHALKPMAFIVGISAGVHILFRILLSGAWSKLNRIQRGRE